MKVKILVRILSVLIRRTERGSRSLCAHGEFTFFEDTGDLPIMSPSHEVLGLASDFSSNGTASGRVVVFRRSWNQICNRKKTRDLAIPL